MSIAASYFKFHSVFEVKIYRIMLKFLFKVYLDLEPEYLSQHIE
jgi:hypothetical protein